MYYVKLDESTTEFVLSHMPTDGFEKRFPGTVNGAVALHTYVQATGHDQVAMSSDLNHPREFKKFAKHSIDIVAGYLDGAIKAGVIEVQK